MSSRTWVFGYGSLVSPRSVARTVGRYVDDPDERVITHLHGYGRRWNYGSMHLRGNWIADGRTVHEGLVVSLGLAADDNDSCNGVSILVTVEELAALDRRERDYEMTDVTGQVSVEGDDFSGRVVTFVPRPGAVERYESARDERRAAVERRYWNLVHDAFDDLGAAHRRLFDETPDPDIPVADVELVWP